MGASTAVGANCRVGCGAGGIPQPVSTQEGETGGEVRWIVDWNSWLGYARLLVPISVTLGQARLFLLAKLDLQFHLQGGWGRELGLN